MVKDLGGISEYGIGVGEAQVFPAPPPTDVFSSILASRQKQSLIDQKKKEEAEAARQTKLNKVKLGEFKGHYQQETEFLERKNKFYDFAQKNITNPEMQTEIARQAADVAAYGNLSITWKNQAKDVDKYAAAKAGQLTPEAEIAYTNLHSQKFYDNVKKEAAGNDQIYFQILDNEAAKVVAAPKAIKQVDVLKDVVPYFTNLKPITFTTEKEAKDAVESGIATKTTSGTYYPTSQIEARVQQIRNFGSEAAKNLTDAELYDIGATTLGGIEAGGRRVTKTGETITIKAKGGDGGLSKDDIVVDKDIQIKAASADKPETYKSPFSLPLPTNETLNISNSPHIIDRDTGVPVGNEATQFNTTGGEIHTVIVKRASDGKNVYEQQLFATATEPTTGLKYNVQIPVKDIKNSLKKHTAAIDEMQKKIDELNKGGQKTGGGAAGEKKEEVGTKENPITIVKGMTFEKGKYYKGKNGEVQQYK